MSLDDLSLYLLAAAVILVLAGPFVYSVLSGGAKPRPSGTYQDHARIAPDLGPVRHSYTNYSPWRLPIGVALLLIGLALAGVAVLEEVVAGVKLLAGAGILFGTIILAYVLLTSVDRLVLHTRGLVFYRGRTIVGAAYYGDIRAIDYSTVTYTTNGVQGRPIAKALLISLSTGGGLEVGNNFVGFSEIATIIQECSKACAASESVVGRYLVTGRHQFNDTQEEYTIEARSPQHAREIALEKYGVIVESCNKIS